MNEKFNKNVNLEQLTYMFLSREEEKGLIVKDPSYDKVFSDVARDKLHNIYRHVSVARW